MKWYSGPVQDAIAAAKHERKIFLVFVEGKDETSQNMAQKITEEDISSVVDEHCVSVKLMTDSEPFRQFSQIYPVIVVPSMFFIGNNGIPLEVIAGSENKEELLLKIEKAIQLHKSKLPDATPSGSSSSTASNTSSVPPQESSSGGDSANETPVKPVASSSGVSAVCEPNETPLKPEASTNDVPATESEEATVQALLKQKVERAEQLMAERRKLREKEEKEEERQREMEQRRAGRELQKAREQMKEKEMADWAKQRQREKEEDKAARERVLAQIAQDKADRAAKFQYTSTPPPSEGAASSQSSAVRQRSPPESASASVSSQEAKIQFRLPNSETSLHEFPAGATLNDVVRHVEQVIKPGLSAFTLATSFPRRHFAKADYSRTLQELELCPAAVLLVLPVYAVSTSHGGNSNRIWALLWTILSPLTIVWNFMYSFIFGSSSTQQTAPVQNDIRGSASPESTAPQNNPRQTGNKSGSNSKASESSSRYRRDGNIHHLSNESSNDDEDGTWNGNSTQQM